MSSLQPSSFRFSSADYQEQYHHLFMSSSEDDHDHNDDGGYDGYNEQQQQQQQQQQQLQDRLAQEAQLQHKIAQSMLTPRAAVNNNTTRNNYTTTIENDDDFGMDDEVPTTFMGPPPWENEFIDNDDANNISTSPYHHHHGTAQFPTMTPPHQLNINDNEMYMPTIPTNEAIIGSTNSNIAMRNEPPPPLPPLQPPVVATATATLPNPIHNHTTTNNNNNNGPSSTKSVTFRTHDQYHSWDEQLDILKHVDEEFFNVAYYLLDVINVGSVVVEGDANVGHYYLNDDNDYNGSGHDDSSTPVNNNCGSGSGSGSGADNILARIFTFHCGTSQDVDLFTGGYYSNNTTNDGQERGGGGGGGWSHYHHPTNKNINYNHTSTFGGGGNETKKYKLTKKLVQDFEQAVKFRMNNIIETTNNNNDSGGIMEEESEVVTRTREIAAKIEAYGLPGMSIPTDAANDDDDDDDDGVPSPHQQSYHDGGPLFGSEHDVEASSKLERRKPCHFPILPTDDDDDDDSGGMDENERRFYNTFGNISILKESAATHNRRRCHSQSSSPFKSVCQLFSTLVGPRTPSSTPSKEQCQIRLQQIQREIHNAERMMESCTSTEVISACVKRINKLKDEERMHQIFKERYKIQAMIQATESESVKKACSQRLYQLTAELNSIDLDQYDEELEDDNDKGTGVEQLDERIVAKATGGEDLDWYERARRYVRSHEPQSPRLYHNTAAAVDGDGDYYRPHNMQQYQYPHQYSRQYPPPHPGYNIPNNDDENYYDRHYPEKQHFSSPSSAPRRVLSPRNGRPLYPHGSSPRRQPFTNNHYPPY